MPTAVLGQGRAFSYASLSTCGNPKTGITSTILDDNNYDSDADLRGLGEEEDVICRSSVPEENNMPAELAEQCAESDPIFPSSQHDEYTPIVQDGSDRKKRSTDGTGFDRIVGGQIATPHSYPWQVRARICSSYRCTYLCGGSLISSRFAITAAHCIPYRGDRGLVTVGAHYIFDNDPNSSARNYTIDRVIGHPEWNRYQRVNDIALVRTATSMQASIDDSTGNVQPICMPSPDVCFSPGTLCIVTGWGYDSERARGISPDLREVAVRIIPNDWCAASSQYGSRWIHDTQVCAGYAAGGRDSCSGDSG